MVPSLVMSRVVVMVSALGRFLLVYQRLQVRVHLVGLRLVVEGH